MRKYEKVSKNVLDIISNTIRDNTSDLDTNITKAKIISLFVLVKKCDFAGKMGQSPLPNGRGLHREEQG